VIGENIYVQSGQPMAIGARAILAGPRTPGPLHRRGERREMAWNEGWTDPFLQSREWRTVRMRVLEKHGAKCQCCGRTPRDGITITVDHIKPRTRYPELALTESNLQILCNECNHGKGNWSERDWRDSVAARELPADGGAAAMSALLQAVVLDPEQARTPFVARFSPINWAHVQARAAAACIDTVLASADEVTPAALVDEWRGTEYEQPIAEAIAAVQAAGADTAVDLLRPHEADLNAIYENAMRDRSQ
jgi:hypothetical protein